MSVLLRVMNQDESSGDSLLTAAGHFAWVETQVLFATSASHGMSWLIPCYSKSFLSSQTFNTSSAQKRNCFLFTKKIALLYPSNNSTNSLSEELIYSTLFSFKWKNYHCMYKELSFHALWLIPYPVIFKLSLLPLSSNSPSLILLPSVCKCTIILSIFKTLSRRAASLGMASCFIFYRHFKYHFSVLASFPFFTSNSLFDSVIPTSL